MYLEIFFALLYTCENDIKKILFTSEGNFHIRKYSLDLFIFFEMKISTIHLATSLPSLNKPKTRNTVIQQMAKQEQHDLEKSDLPTTVRLNEALFIYWLF